MILHLLSSTQEAISDQQPSCFQVPARLTQRINQVDQPPGLVLVLEIHVRRLVDDDRLEVGSESNVIRRPKGFLTQVSECKPSDLVNGPRDFDFSPVDIDRRLGA